MDLPETQSYLMPRYKIVFVGDIGVGKTSVLSRIVENDFREQYEVLILKFICYSSQHSGLICWVKLFTLSLTVSN
jgi:GTPase SAR1 family protein